MNLYIEEVLKHHLRNYLKSHTEVNFWRPGVAPDFSADSSEKQSA